MPVFSERSSIRDRLLTPRPLYCSPRIHIRSVFTGILGSSVSGTTALTSGHGDVSSSMSFSSRSCSTCATSTSISCECSTPWSTGSTVSSNHSFSSGPFPSSSSATLPALSKVLSCAPSVSRLVGPHGRRTRCIAFRSEVLSFARVSFLVWKSEVLPKPEQERERSWRLPPT